MLYCHFNKIIKGPGTSFQSPALSQKHVRNDLARRTVSDKVLRNKPFNITKIPKYDEYQRGFTSMVYKYFYKKSTSLANKFAKGSGFKSAFKQNEQLAEELHKPIIKNLKKETYILLLKTIFGVLMLQI